MGHVIVTVGSVTTATRLKKALEKRRGSADIIHTPAALSSGSCSYSIRTEHRYLFMVKEISKDLGLKTKGFYMEENIKGEKRYHAIP